MARLHYSFMTSLDGYIADASGNFDWTTPDEEVHTFINDLERPIGTYLYGRRLYETMVYWESVDDADAPAYIADYTNIWRATDKIVYSSTLSAPTSARTRIERVFEPDAVLKLKASSERDLSIGGPHLAAHALRAGLADDLHRFIAPIVVGGGTSFLADGIRQSLHLKDERRFTKGWVYLHYTT